MSFTFKLRTCFAGCYPLLFSCVGYLALVSLLMYVVGVLCLLLLLFLLLISLMVSSLLGDRWALNPVYPGRFVRLDKKRK